MAMSKRPSMKWLDLQEPPPDPKDAALFGPRDLKEPGSQAWIIQTTHRAQGILVSLEHDTEEWLKIVAEIEGAQVWEKYPKEKPYGTREAYFRGEFGKLEPELTRAKVEQQLAKHGRPRKGAEKGSNTTFSRDSHYIRARLERDGKTELLAKIERGELSAHAAAVEAGFRTRMVQIAPTVQGFARAARKHLSAADRVALGKELIDET